MLLGEYEHTIDEKNRLTLPAKFRQAVAGGLVLTRGLDACIYAYPLPAWERLVEDRLEPLDPLTPEARRMVRFFFSRAPEVEPHPQGRVMVPQALLKHPGLRHEVVLAGVR